MSSHDADTDTGVPMPRPLAEASARLADFGLYGIAWLNRDLTVAMTYGPLVDFIAHGKPLCDSVLAFYGMDDDILALRDAPAQLLEMPAIAVAVPDVNSKRLNFTVFWLPDEDRPLLLAYRANSQTELELELSKQIRARLMAEAEIEQKSKELARANADLESFAAIVLHDLKAPLRHMRTIADDVIMTAALRGEDGEVDKLQQLQVLSRRMSHMLTELFDYASLGRKNEALDAVDTRAMAETIKESLPDAARRIAIEGAWPTVTTLAAPLDLVLRNLIQNAIQHHDRGDGTVTLSCTDAPDCIVFSVSDDGPGIAPEHHDAVFLPFRTLEGRAKGGTGMGLAMVKKTLETLGGKIFLSSDPRVERGATFAVYWPKQISL